VISAAVDVSKERFGFKWVETGGPSVQMPTRQSFGTRLIEQGFVGELRGEAHLSFEPSGVVCKLDIPLASLVPVKKQLSTRKGVTASGSRNGETMSALTAQK